MANITNPEAVSFCNTKGRPMADDLVNAYYGAKKLVTFWNSNTMFNIIPNDSSLIVDGSATDGRQPITGAQVYTLISYAQALVTAFEASTNLELNSLSQIAVNVNP